MSLRQIIRLNGRALSLALRNRYLTSREVAASYDTVAATYDSEWAVQLAEVTGTLLAHLPPGLPDGPWLDLGCGTGGVTAQLPAGSVGVDCSAGMLAIARARCPAHRFEQGDLLAYLRGCPRGAFGNLVSGWAIGYSRPREVIAEAARVLRPGGVFAFTVNYFDTLQPVFRAYSRCLLRFPGEWSLAMHPRFPKTAAALLKPLRRAGFETCFRADGHIPIRPPSGGPVTLDWLLKTGVLAGFDRALPLREHAALRAEFTRRLGEEPVFHHYFAGVFRQS